MDQDTWIYSGSGGPHDDRDECDEGPTCHLCGKPLERDERTPCVECQLEFGSAD